MLDPRLLRTDPTAVAEALRRRGFDFDAPAYEALEARRKQAQHRVAQHRAQGAAGGHGEPDVHDFPPGPRPIRARRSAIFASSPWFTGS